MSGVSMSTIYEPPRDGLPFLVVTLVEGEVVAYMHVWSRDEAREILAAQTMRSGRPLPVPLREAEERVGQVEVTFVVTLDDGSNHWITIDSFTLRNGDDIAPQIALERQARGQIPAGAIVSVRRLFGE